MEKMAKAPRERMPTPLNSFLLLLQMQRGMEPGHDEK